MATPEVDNEMRDRFLDDIKKLSAGQYESWKADRDGKLAATILVD